MARKELTPEAVGNAVWVDGVRVVLLWLVLGERQASEGKQGESSDGAHVDNG